MKTFFFHTDSFEEKSEVVQFTRSNIKQDHKYNPCFDEDCYPIGVLNATHWRRIRQPYKEKQISRGKE